MMRVYYISGLDAPEVVAVQEKAKELHLGVDIMPGGDVRIWCYQDDVTDSQWDAAVDSLRELVEV